MKVCFMVAGLVVCFRAYVRVWECVCVCICLCVWAPAYFILKFYEDIIILLRGFLKSYVSVKVPDGELTAVCCYRNTFSDEDKISHHLKWETAVGQRDSHLFCKLREEILTEYVLLHREVFWQEGSSGTSFHNFSHFSSSNISHSSHKIPTQRKKLYK